MTHRWRLIVVAVSVIIVLGIVLELSIVSFSGYRSEDFHEVVDHKVTLRVDGNRNAYTQSTINVSTGSKVRIMFINSAHSKAHNWVMGKESILMDDLVQSGHDAGSSSEYLPDDSLTYAATPLVAPNDRVTIEFDAPQASGEYVFLCTVPGHSESGMHGTVIVSE